MSTTSGSTGRVAERREDNVLRSLGQNGNPGHLLHLQIPQAGHGSQNGRQLLRAAFRQRNVVRVRTNRTVVMIRGHGGESAALRRQPPETAPRGLGAGELFHCRGHIRAESHGHRPPAQIENLLELVFECFVVRHDCVLFILPRAGPAVSVQLWRTHSCVRVTLVFRMGASPTDSDENGIEWCSAKVRFALEQLSLYSCLAWERGEVAMNVRLAPR